NALVRIERKDRFAPQSLGAALDPSDCGIAILYRKGKIARHEGGAHPIKLGSGYFPTKYERLRAAADRAIEGTDAYFMSLGRGNGFPTDLDLTRPAIPKGRGDIGAFADSHFPRSRTGIAGGLTCYKQ